MAGFIALWFFMSRSPCRVVTTSADHTQLEGVLWGEIRRYIQTAKYSLRVEEGGPLFINDLHIRKAVTNSNGIKERCGISYLIGRVAAKGEGMLGHHVADTGDGIPRTLFMADEASGVDDLSYERASTWMRRCLCIGNCYEGPPGCTFFKRACQGGDLLQPASKT